MQQRFYTIICPRDEKLQQRPRSSRFQADVSLNNRESGPFVKNPTDWSCPDGSSEAVSCVSFWVCDCTYVRFVSS